MTFSSISLLQDATRRIFLRFPGALLSGILAAAVAIKLVGRYPAPERLFDLLMVASLGIPLFTALRLCAEKSPSGRPLRRSWIAMAVGLLFLVLYWYLLRRDPGDGRYLRFFQVSLALHLAVAVAPFLGRGEINGFWQFNRRLFLRFCLSAIYATVFFGGLALALAGVDHLFDVEVNDKIYPRLWLFTVFVFQTWHFLGGVPSDLDDLDRDRQHPRALRVFSQYMLVPLVVVDFLILYTYMGKILLTREWPQGWVGWLVSYAAIFGVLTLLLLHPGRQDSESRWVEVFGRVFYAAVLPLLGLLFVALGKRVGQYGMTERRYFLLVLGLWLGGVALYMLLGAAKNIKLVPVTLGLLALATCWGPWGAYQTSLRSQSRRLESLLTRNGLLSDGRIARSSTAVPPDDLKEISAAVDYIAVNHGARRLNRWSDRDWSGVGSGSSSWERRTLVRQEFLAAMGLEYTLSRGGSRSYAYYNARDDELDVAGYERLVPFRFGQHPAAGEPERYAARLGHHGRTAEILKGSTVILAESLEPMMTRLQTASRVGRDGVPASDMTLTAANSSVRVKVCFTNLVVVKQAEGSASVQSGAGYLLVDSLP